MSHSSGLSGWKETVTTEDLYDWDKVTASWRPRRPTGSPGRRRATTA